MVQHQGCLSNQTEDGDFDTPDVNCEYHTADRNRSRRFLEHLVENFLVQVLKEMTRTGVLFDLLLVNRVKEHNELSQVLSKKEASIR